ncbi:MAG: hypothetical protein KDB07_13235, partial [Planctomycetes bacterium]|nr:hypothetical protein [Planctomycetota bacterium]
MEQIEDTTLPRYVIQAHTWGGFTHFDLMFEVAGWERLRTFQLPQEPTQAAVKNGISLREIAPHRRQYLDYEGPVSEGRGEVKIWDTGRIRTLQHAARLVEFELLSKQGRKHA